MGIAASRPVIVMLTVNVTGAQGMGKLSGLLCIKSKAVIFNVWSMLDAACVHI